MTAPAPRPATPLANALLFAGTLLLLLPLAEVVVRIAAPQTLPSQSRVRQLVVKDMYVADDKAGFRLAPNFKGRIEYGAAVTEFATNSLGLRDDEIGEKAPGRERILFLGDSFVWGWGVSQGEEWVSQLEPLLNDARGPASVECINGGVNAYGTEAELALLERLGPTLSPDLVLVAFFTNDFTDNLLGATGVYTVKDGYLFDRFTQKHFQENVLERTSHLYRLAKRGYGEARRRLLKLPPSTRPVREFSEEDFAEGKRLSEKHLLAMRDWCASHGARFGIVWLHADVYVLPREEPDVPIQRELQASLAAAGVPSIDLLPILRKESSRSGLFIPGDGHFTVRGNKVAARAVGRWLLGSGLLGASSDDPAAEAPADSAVNSP